MNAIPAEFTLNSNHFQLETFITLRQNQNEYEAQEGAEQSRSTRLR